MQKKVTISDTTIQSIIKIFFFNFQNRSPQQHTNMAMTLKSFCESFNDTENYVKEIMEVYTDPVKYVIEKHPDFYSLKVQKRMKIKKSLANLDWMFFRDTCLASKLSKEYSQDVRKSFGSRQRITLSEVIDILGLLKADLYSILVDVASQTNTTLEMDLSRLTPNVVEQVGVGKVANP